MEKGLLYNKGVARGFKQIVEIINDVYKICKKPASAKDPRFSTKFIVENGFYLKSVEIDSLIFFGIWYGAWEHFECPIIIDINYLGRAPVSKHSQIKSWFEKKGIDAIIFREYEDHAMLVFQESFYNFEDDAERMYKLLNDLNAFLEVQYKIENP